MRPLRTAFYVVAYAVSEFRKLWNDIAEILNAPPPEPLQCECVILDQERLRAEDCPIHGVPSYLS